MTKLFITKESIRQDFPPIEQWIHVSRKGEYPALFIATSFAIYGEEFPDGGWILVDQSGFPFGITADEFNKHYGVS